MNETKKELPHTGHHIILEERSHLVISGVSDVVAFEDENVQLKTIKGDLTIRGSCFKMESYQSEAGDLVMQGDVYALVYVNDGGRKEGFFSRLMK